MVFNKMKSLKLRKSQNTMTGLVMGILIVMAIFFGGYLYIANNVENAGLSVDSKYSDSYSNLTTGRTDLEKNIQEVRDSLDDIVEADNVAQVAWNGLKGLGATLKLPVSFINSALQTWESVFPMLDVLPGWFLALIFVGVLGFITFLVLRVLKGETAL